MLDQCWSMPLLFGHHAFTQSNIDKIEKVQRKAARFVFNDYYRYSSVTNMLNCLKWESLEHRRTKSTIIMFYKIINNIVSADFSNYLHRSFTRTRGHQMRFMTIPAKRNTYYHSFLPTAIQLSKIKIKRIWPLLWHVTSQPSPFKVD